VGDYLQVVVDTYAQQNELLVVIVGTFDYFPTWYPQTDGEGDDYLFVGNLDYLFAEAGGQYPYDVWLRTSSDIDDEAVVKEIRRMRIRVEEWETSSLTIAEAQQRPERQGLFGMLSVGFIATAVITVLGFLLYALLSFRQRFIELGVMRAIGLSRRQMIGLLAWELILLIVPGGVVGTILGVGVSHFFIPYMQVGADAFSRVPPFIVQIPWSTIAQIHILFGALFIFALVGYIVLLLRMQVFRAIKLGETV
jgi:putative ABC transport system permease protein